MTRQRHPRGVTPGEVLLTAEERLDRLLSRTSVAELLAISEKTLDRYIRVGVFPVVKVGPRAVRIPARSVLDYIARQTEKRTEGLGRPEAQEHGARVGPSA